MSNTSPNRKVLIVLLAIATLSLVFFAFARSKADGYLNEDEIAAYLEEQLVEQGVPMKAISVQGNNPAQIEITLQSASTEKRMSPEDPAYLHAVDRVLTLVPNGLFRVGLAQITLLNASGAYVLFWGEYPIKEDVEPELSVKDPGSLADLESLIQGNIVLYGLSLDNITVENTKSGVFVVLDLSTKDVETANEVLPQFMSSLYERWPNGEEKGVQIAVLKVNLYAQDGDPLLIYTHDYQLAQEDWWMHDQLTSDWFPLPDE